MRSLVVVAFTFVLGSFAHGQTLHPKIDEVSVEQRLADLEQRLSRIETILARLPSTQNSAKDAGSESDGSSAQDDIANFQREVRSRLDALEDRLTSGGAQGGDAGAADLPGILSAMEKNPALREELFKATNGRFEVHNSMSNWMSVRLNGQRWRFPPGVSSIYVPFGVVQVQLVDGGDRYTFNEEDWIVGRDELLLRMGITTQLPQQE